MKHKTHNHVRSSCFLMVRKPKKDYTDDREGNGNIGFQWEEGLSMKGLQ
jgi:hypothetical protein